MGRTTTYARLVDEIKKCAKSLKTIGVRAGDKVTIAEWFKRGANFVGCGDDIAYMSLGCRATFDFLKENGFVK